MAEAPALEALPVELIPIAELLPLEYNPRPPLTPERFENLRRSMQAEQGLLSAKPIIVNKHPGRENRLIAGNQRWLVAQAMGWQHLVGIRVDAPPEQERRWALIDNNSWGEYDYDLLRSMLAEMPNTDILGFPEADINALLGLPEVSVDDLLEEGDGEAAGAPPARTLAEQFLAPPFSVLDARQGYWQARKNAWLGLGLELDAGRVLFGGVAAATGPNSAMNKISGRLGRDALNTAHVVSQFDPVLAEIACRWFAPKKARVLDPFAGGPQRAVVCSWLGHEYVGVDLYEQQLQVDERSAARILSQRYAPEPRFIRGDSRELVKLYCDSLGKPTPAPIPLFDLLLACPPYYDLELYGEDGRDLSRALSYESFLAGYQDCLASATQLMAPEAFAFLVVGTFRDHKQGFVHDFPGDTTRAMQALGWGLYNEAVYLQAVGTLSVRAALHFRTMRKLGRTHQSVLIFRRGKPSLIPTRLGKDPTYGEGWNLMPEAEVEPEPLAEEDAPIEEPSAPEAQEQARSNTLGGEL
jgi:hypothetical protein